jgi:hypothetical protein
MSMRIKMRNFLTGGLVVAGGLMLAATPVQAVTIYQDAITGNNQFQSSDGKHYWFVDPGADSYANDFYERPTVQTYQTKTATTLVPNYSGDVVQGTSYYAAGGSSPSYFEYLDIVTGRIAYDEGKIYFGIELFGVNKVGDNGVRTPDFGESSLYNVRFGNDPNGAGSLLLRAENPKDLTGSWQSKEAFGYLDVNSGVGGPGGITTVNETSNLNGFESKVISDGHLETGAKPLALEIRRVLSEDSRPLVEFSFDLDLFNEMYPNYAIDINDPLYFVFEATRGLKGTSDYLWNDKYSISEAGTPYLDANGQPQNIYELDTLRGVFNLTDDGDDDLDDGGGQDNPPDGDDDGVIPEPMTAFLGAMGLGLLAFRRNRG